MAFPGSGEDLQTGKYHRPDIPLGMRAPISRCTITYLSPVYPPLADTIISVVTVTEPHPHATAAIARCRRSSC